METHYVKKNNSVTRQFWAWLSLLDDTETRVYSLYILKILSNITQHKLVTFWSNTQLVSQKTQIFSHTIIYLLTTKKTPVCTLSDLCVQARWDVLFNWVTHNLIPNGSCVLPTNILLLRNTNFLTLYNVAKVYIFVYKLMWFTKRDMCIWIYHCNYPTIYSHSEKFPGPLISIVKEYLQ